MELIKSFRSIIMMDPPEHDRLRALVSRVFTPKAVTALEPMIREVICGFLEPLDDATEFDAVADFSANFPVEITRLLGMPEPDRQPFRKRLDISLHREHGQLDVSEENMAAIIETGAYFYELAVEKRKNPGDDMMTRLTQVTVDRGDGTPDRPRRRGDHGLRGPPRRRGRVETVTKLVGNAVVLFDAPPRPVAEGPRRSDEDPARSRGDPSHPARRSTRGVTRTPTASSTASRRCRRLPRAAHHRRRDARSTAFREPRRVRHPTGSRHLDRIRARRAQLPRRPLARMESRIALEELAKRWRRFEVDDRGCATSTCRTWPGTRMCRCAWSAEAEPRSPVLH